jgi:hypothetical protein
MSASTKNTDELLAAANAAGKQFAALRKVLMDVPGACRALPPEEQQRYRDAQQSVVDARKSAQTHAGLLQVG